ncbi:MAG: HlyD family efflux transporter periplasmic adaptor subunit [Acidobacteriota bacterium]|nr:MAG: HlyD family efflux transporter periplasmic adaptor subunit [Acidobacteriota bacterium]
MDVPRSKSVVRNRRIRQAIYMIIGLAVIGGISVALARLKPAAPSVAGSTLWMDTVKRGEMIRQVRGLGTLVPEEIVWIPATTSGRVEKRLVQPGTIVSPETVIFELSNPELQQQLMDAQAQLKSAEAAYNNRKVELETQLLNQRAQAATVEADYQQARLTAEANDQLSRDGLVSELILKQSRTRAAELKTRNELEKQRLAMNAEAIKTQMAVVQAELDQRKLLYDLRLRQVADLKVRAGINGVLQQLAVEVGQQVTPGTNLARVSDPKRLKAAVRIPETQAKDILPGQIASIDMRIGVIPGRVSRIDPAVQNGTVTVDIALEGELPKGARPDLNVDGTIELERLENVLYVQRPAFGQEKSTIKLFRLEPDGKHAEAVTVQLGRSSVTTIEIVNGLKVGDRVIVSDTSQVADNASRIRLD